MTLINDPASFNLIIQKCSEGETVRIMDGPFADFMAVVDELSLERGKVRLLVSFFGRETPVEMDFMQVEKI